MLYMETASYFLPAPRNRLHQIARSHSPGWADGLGTTVANANDKRCYSTTDLALSEEEQICNAGSRSQDPFSTVSCVTASAEGGFAP